MIYQVFLLINLWINLFNLWSPKGTYWTVFEFMSGIWWYSDFDWTLHFLSGQTLTVLITEQSACLHDLCPSQVKYIASLCDSNFLFAIGKDVILINNHFIFCYCHKNRERIFSLWHFPVNCVRSSIIKIPFLIVIDYTFIPYRCTVLFSMPLSANIFSHMIFKLHINII